MTKPLNKLIISINLLYHYPFVRKKAQINSNFNQIVRIRRHSKTGHF